MEEDSTAYEKLLASLGTGRRRRRERRRWCGVTTGGELPSNDLTSAHGDLLATRQPIPPPDSGESGESGDGGENGEDGRDDGVGGGDSDNGDNSGDDDGDSADGESGSSVLRGIHCMRCTVAQVTTDCSNRCF